MGKVKVIKAIVERYYDPFKFLDKEDVIVEDKRYGKPVKYVAQVKYSYEAFPGGCTVSYAEELEIRLNMDLVFEDEATALAFKLRKTMKENVEKTGSLFEDCAEALKWIVDNIIWSFENYERHVKMYEITSDYPKGKVEVTIYD